MGLRAAAFFAAAGLFLALDAGGLALVFGSFARGFALAVRACTPSRSVNARSLDTSEGVDLRITDFDGQNWEANASELAHLSKEPA